MESEQKDYEKSLMMSNQRRECFYCDDSEGTMFQWNNPETFISRGIFHGFFNQSDNQGRDNVVALIEDNTGQIFTLLAKCIRFNFEIPEDTMLKGELW